MIKFFKKLNDNSSVKNTILKVINKKKSLIPKNLINYIDEFEKIVDSITEYEDSWNNLPIVLRLAQIKTETSEKIIHKEIIVLPDINHNLDLVLKMLNHKREEKQLRETNNPFFINTDELFMEYKKGKINYRVKNILFQLVIFFQKGSLINLGLVAGDEYVILFI